jgi:hypothetical protein
LALLAIAATPGKSSSDSAEASDSREAQLVSDLTEKMAILRSSAMDLVRLRLKDPWSTTFGEVRPHHNGTVISMCGTVNAKNSMGSYTGYKNFVVSPAARIVSIDGDDSFPADWANFCS